MKYGCRSVLVEEKWLTVGKIYEAELEEINKYLPALEWIRLKKADDGFPCYARREQFERVE